MTKPTIKIHNTKTDEIIEREMNEVEFAEYLIDVEKAQVRESQAQVKAAAKAALLERLGITEEEAKLLLG